MHNSFLVLDNCLLCSLTGACISEKYSCCTSGCVQLSLPTVLQHMRPPMALRFCCRSFLRQFCMKLSLHFMRLKVQSWVVGSGLTICPLFIGLTYCVCNYLCVTAGKMCYHQLSHGAVAVCTKHKSLAYNVLDSCVTATADQAPLAHCCSSLWLSDMPAGACLLRTKCGSRQC